MLTYLFAAFIQIFWGMTPTAATIVLQEMPRQTYMGLRYLGGGLILLVIGLCLKKIHLRLKDLPALIGIGVITFSAAQFFMIMGLQMGGVVQFSAASAVGPLAMALMARLLVGEALTKQFWTAIFFYLIGSLVVASAGSSHFAISAQVLLCFFVVAIGYFCETTGLVLSKKLNAKWNIFTFVSVAQIAAGLFMLMQSFASGNQISHFSFSSKIWWALLFIVIVPTVICYFSWFYLIRKMPAQKLGFFEAVHVVSAMFFGWWWLGEKVNPETLIGMGFLLLSLLVILKKPKKNLMLGEDVY